MVYAAVTGWTWVQLRGVDAFHIKDDMEFLILEGELLMAFCANPCFSKATIVVELYWQGNPQNFKGPMSTVIATVLDMDNCICQQASREGVCMFG
jgi:hypothetical protein